MIRVKANKDCGKLDSAVEMLLELKKRAKDESALNRIVGYPGDLAALGPILRHVSAGQECGACGACG